MPSWNDLEKIATTINNEEEMQKVKIGTDFATKLISARLKQNLTQEELAERAGLKQSAISRIENNGSLPRLDTIYKIAHALGSEINFYPSEKTISLEDNVELLVHRISKLEELIKDLYKEVRIMKRQNKRPTYLSSEQYFEDDSYKTKVSSFAKLVDTSIVLPLIEQKGADEYDRWC